jgi:hypothetical protein
MVCKEKLLKATLRFISKPQKEQTPVIRIVTLLQPTDTFSIRLLQELVSFNHQLTGRRYNIPTPQLVQTEGRFLFVLLPLALGM